MSDRLEQIAERHAATTQRTWTMVDYRHGDAAAETWLGVLCGAIEITAREFQVCGIKYSALPTPENWANARFIAAAHQDIPWLLSNTTNALAYIDRILGDAGHNAAELMFLTRLKDILTGLDDGRPVNQTEDKTDGR